MTDTNATAPYACRWCADCGTMVDEQTGTCGWCMSVDTDTEQDTPEEIDFSPLAIVAGDTVAVHNVRTGTVSHEQVAEVGPTAGLYAGEYSTMAGQILRLESDGVDVDKYGNDYITGVVGVDVPTEEQVVANDTLRIQCAAASALLADAIVALADSTIAATGVRPYHTSDAPNNWEDLQAFADNPLGFLPVWNGASETSIYGSTAANYAFRYWHDMGHLEHGLSFSPEDERELQLSHHLVAVAKRLTETDGSNETIRLALELYRADTIGQIEYSVANRRFPDNQIEFCIAYVADPAAAIATHF